jgi:hypothetical protein
MSDWYQGWRENEIEKKGLTIDQEEALRSLTYSVASTFNINAQQVRREIDAVFDSKPGGDLFKLRYEKLIPILQKARLKKEDESENDAKTRYDLEQNFWRHQNRYPVFDCMISRSDLETAKKLYDFVNSLYSGEEDLAVKNIKNECGSKVKNVSET